MNKLNVFLSFLLFTGGVYAGGPSHLTADELKSAFSDKTQYCNQIGKDKTCKTYNGPDGRVVRVMDADGARREGNWWIDEEAHYCLKWDIKKNNLCFLVYDAGNGEYDLYKKGKHKAHITRMVDGDPLKL